MHKSADGTSPSCMTCMHCEYLWFLDVPVCGFLGISPLNSFKKKTSKVRKVLPDKHSMALPFCMPYVHDSHQNREDKDGRHERLKEWKCERCERLCFHLQWFAFPSNEIGVWEATRSRLRSNFPGGACPQTPYIMPYTRHPSWEFGRTGFFVLPTALLYHEH